MAIFAIVLPFVIVVIEVLHVSLILPRGKHDHGKDNQEQSNSHIGTSNDVRVVDPSC